MCCWWKTIGERGTGLSEYPKLAYGFRVLSKNLGLRGGTHSARWPTFIWRFPDKPEVRISHFGGPYKAPARLRNWSQTSSEGSSSRGNTRFLRHRGGSAFCLWSLANARSLIQNLWLTLNSPGKLPSESGQNWNTHSPSAFPYAGGQREKAKSKGLQEAAWKNLLRCL